MGDDTTIDDGGCIRVLFVAPPDGMDPAAVLLPETSPTEARGFDVSTTSSDADLWPRLARDRPQVIVTFGDVDDHPTLAGASLQVRRRWIHADDGSTADSTAGLAQRILDAFVANATTDRFVDHPLVSVITPTHGTGASLLEAHRSLCEQTYAEWEWVVYDDSPADGPTALTLRELASTDPRVRVYRGTRHDGSIGSVKRRACGLADGALVVELDHDDRLLPRCLELVVGAAAAFPEAGFFYSDGAEVFDDGTPATYGDGWAFGFGAYRREVVEGRELAVQCAPPVNAKTIRHITGAPNHVRAWRAETYWSIGGHRGDLMVCDDFDLCIRMFLATRLVHIPECCYVQVHHGGQGENTQRGRNREIQRLTRALLRRHHRAIHDRFVALGIDDFVWSDGDLDWSREGPNDGAPANLVFAPGQPV